MSVPSHLSVARRRTPIQERGERRVAALLDSAAAVIAKSGYEAATMSEIAGRAGASIGSLYQFFPNKKSLAEELRAEYCRELQLRWEPLKRDAQNLNLRELVDHLINIMVGFYEDHPAFLKLLDAPLSPGRFSARLRFREQLRDLFAERKPRMPHQQAQRLAVVTQQIMRALRVVYAESKPAERPYFVQEFKALLLCYFRTRIKAPALEGRGLK
ncbi:MAG: TetR/AcrR family transcriptional regulator [Bryobacteraceae bacterium]